MTVAAVQFPGQLSEHVGMARTAVRLCPDTSRLLEKAERRTGLPIGRLCEEGPEAELQQDRAAAVAMVTVNHMLWTCLGRRGVAVSAVAGHSVGYTSALVASGALSFEAAIDVVILVDEAIDRLLGREGIDGAMGVVVGLSESEVSAEAARAPGRCDVACINAATQIALSGDRPAVLAALDSCRPRAMAVHVMPMGKPMHSRILVPLAEELRTRLSRIPVRDPLIPLVSHLNGLRLRSGQACREILAVQLGSRVRWPDALHELWKLAGGSRSRSMLLECGSQDVLTRLSQWIDRSIPARALSQESSWTFAEPVRA